MAVKIIISRKVPKGRGKDIIPLLKQLRTLALHQPGYIAGETLRNVNDPEDYKVISTWISPEEWHKWESNPKRYELQKQIDDILGTSTNYGIYYYE